MTRLPAETHLFVVWEHGRAHAPRILADIRRRFTVLAGYEITWSAREDPRHFSRLYGQSLPPGSDKVAQCGLGPFLLLVVRDEHPHYGRRRKWGKRVVVNTHLFDAKERYRTWTAGARVHNSTDQAEADRDLFVLLGRRREEFEALREAWDGAFTPVERDPAGTDGWDDLAHLLTAVDLTLPSVLLPSADLTEARVRLLVEASFDHWGVEWLVAAPDDVPLAARGPEYPVVVGDVLTVLELHRIGDGQMPAGAQQELLESRVRDAQGGWVPHPRQAYWVLLQAVVTCGRPVSEEQRERLALAAADAGAEPVDPSLPDAVERAYAARRQDWRLPAAPAQRHRRSSLTDLLGGSPRQRV